MSGHRPRWCGPQFSPLQSSQHHITSHLSSLFSFSLCLVSLFSRARSSGRALELSRTGCKQTVSSFLSSRHRRFLNPRECFRTRFWTFSSSVASIKSVCALLIFQASHADCGEPFERKTRSDTLPQRRTPIFFLFPTIGNPRAELSFLVFLQENQSFFVLSVVSATRLQMAMYSLRHCSHSVRSTIHMLLLLLLLL
jgi:hypothetical protein